MSAETLRRAAEVMRERAQAATEGPWRAEPSDGDVWAPDNREAICRTRSFAYHRDADHIASWHPAVALAVADWLENTVPFFEQFHDGGGHPALTVARAYLGESA